MPNYIGDMLNAYDTQYQNRQNRQMNDMKIQQAQGEASQRAQQMEDEKLMRANAKKSWRETPMLVGLHDMLLNELDPTDTAGKQKLDSFWTDNRTAETIGQLLPIHQKDMENHIKKNQMVQAPVFENGQYVNKYMKPGDVATSNLNQELAFQKYKDELPTNTFTIHPETGAIENTKVPASMAKSIDMQNDINLFLYKAKIQNDNANQILQAKNEVLNTPQQFELPDGTLSPMMTLSAFKTWLPTWGKQKTNEVKQELLVPLTLDDGTVLPVSPQFYADYMQKKQTGTGKGSSRSGGGDDNPPTITIQENGVWKTISNPNYKPPTQALPVVTTQTPEVNPVGNVNYDMPNPDMNRIGTSTEDDAFVYSTSPQRPVEVNNVPPTTVTPANVPNPTAITQPTLGAVQGMGSIKDQTDAIGVGGNQAYMINPVKDLSLYSRYSGDKNLEYLAKQKKLSSEQGLPKGKVWVPVWDMAQNITRLEAVDEDNEELLTKRADAYDLNRRFPMFNSQGKPTGLLPSVKMTVDTELEGKQISKENRQLRYAKALKGTPTYSDAHPKPIAPAKPKVVVVKPAKVKDTITEAIIEYRTHDYLDSILENAGIGLRGRIAYKMLSTAENGYSIGNIEKALTIEGDTINNKHNISPEDIRTAATWAKLAFKNKVTSDIDTFKKFYDGNLKNK